MPKKLILLPAFYYYALITHVGFLAVCIISYQHNLADNFLGLGIMLGWVLALIFQVLHLGKIKHQLDDTNPEIKLRYFAPWISTVLIALNQLWINGSVWHFFIEQTLLEVVSLCIGFVFALLFITNDQGRTAIQDLGCVPFLLLAIILAGALPFFFSWWQISIRRNHFPAAYITTTILAFLSTLIFNMGFIAKLAKREIVLTEVMSDNALGIFLIIGQIVLWFCIPAIAPLFL